MRLQILELWSCKNEMGKNYRLENVEISTFKKM